MWSRLFRKRRSSRGKVGHEELDVDTVLRTSRPLQEDDPHDASADAPLPPGWETRVDSTGRIVFVNHRLHSVSLEHPSLLGGGGAAPAATASAAAAAPAATALEPAQATSLERRQAHTEAWANGSGRARTRTRTRTRSTTTPGSTTPSRLRRLLHLRRSPESSPNTSSSDLQPGPQSEPQNSRSPPATSGVLVLRRHSPAPASTSVSGAGASEASAASSRVSSSSSLASPLEETPRPRARTITVTTRARPRPPPPPSGGPLDLDFGALPLPPSLDGTLADLLPPSLNRRTGSSATGGPRDPVLVPFTMDVYIGRPPPPSVHIIPLESRPTHAPRRRRHSSVPGAAAPARANAAATPEPAQRSRTRALLQTVRGLFSSRSQPAVSPGNPPSASASSSPSSSSSSTSPSSSASPSASATAAPTSTQGWRSRVFSRRSSRARGAEYDDMVLPPPPGSSRSHHPHHPHHPQRHHGHTHMLAGFESPDMFSRLREEIIEAIAFAVLDQQEMDAAQSELSRLERARNVDRLRQAFDELWTEFKTIARDHAAQTAAEADERDAREPADDGLGLGLGLGSGLGFDGDDAAASAGQGRQQQRDGLPERPAPGTPAAELLAELETRLITSRLLFNVSLISMLIVGARVINGPFSERVQRLESCLASHLELMAHGSDHAETLAKLAEHEWAHATATTDDAVPSLSPAWGEGLIPGFEVIAETLRDPALGSAIDVQTIAQGEKRLSYRIKHERFKLDCLRNRSPGKIDIVIRRSHLLEDSREVLARPAQQLKRRMLVQFSGEEGKDLGGLSRDWLGSLGNELANKLLVQGYLEFSAFDGYTLQITPLEEVSAEVLGDFEALGRVVGLGLFHSKLIDVFFVRPVYQRLLDLDVVLQDLETVDADLYAGFEYLLQNDGAEDLGLEFTVDVLCNDGKTRREHELIPGGAQIAVTDENKRQYVDLMLQWKYGPEGGTSRQLHALRRGMMLFVTAFQLKPFSPEEFELLSCGLAHISMDDWKKHTRYDNGYSDESQPVRWFWEALEGFEPEVQARVLQFVTGTSRLPVTGFAGLQGSHGRSMFCICRMGGAEDGRLPVGHTCVNQLDLPEYTSLEELEAKLLQAIDETEGFGLV